MLASEMVVFKKPLSQIRTPRLLTERLPMSFVRNGWSVALGRHDSEDDLQLVFHFYRAAAGFYGCDAVIGLHDGEFAFAVEFVGIGSHAQGESDGLFNSVKI